MTVQANVTYNIKMDGSAFTEQMKGVAVKASNDIMTMAAGEFAPPYVVPG